MTNPAATMAKDAAVTFDGVSKNFGDVKALGADLYELRLFFGPGYRVYFGEHRGRLILILHGGDKSSQTRDIKKARDYWKNYMEDHT